ncbi:uncharacterized protein LOC119190891 [Manduca sexta]|uniref:uncharacterized protein LOC119190891 n=1 Tax=Manduca sexta TaxID=7130 RepID=UPI001890412D|nr:uncharacterized protein LOC119190891 [Manduca sexta]
MFDEMSIKKHLNFNFFTGVIEGFEDIGSGKRTNNVADKALVFMLRGLFSPWKIPIAFYFARDGVKTFVLKNIIKEIVLAVLNLDSYPKWEPCGHPRSNMMEIGTKTIKNHMVKFAAQVFSRHWKWFVHSRNSSFINNLFDSLNGFGHYGNKLKHALSYNSEHIAFWNDAVKKLASMRFDASNERERKPLSLKHFEHNIKTIKHFVLRSADNLWC